MVFSMPCGPPSWTFIRPARKVSAGWLRSRLPAPRLRCEIEGARNAFRAGQLFARTIDDARTALGRVAVAPGCGIDNGPHGGLDQFATHYTMQTERDVHESVINSGAAVDAASAPYQSVPAEGDLGDNVELF